MIAYLIILSLLAVVIFLLNLYCIVPILSIQCFRKPSYLAICSLLFTHVIQALVVIPAYAIKRSEMTTKHKVVCDVYRFSYLYTNYVTCLNQLVITLERLCGCLFPLRYCDYITNKRMKRCLAFVWVYVFMLCLIPFQSQNKRCRYVPQKEWKIFMLVANTFVPFLIIFISYIFIFKKANHILKVRKKVSKSTDKLRPCSMLRRCTRSHLNKSRVTFVIVACFVVCWGPSFVYYILTAICNNCTTKQFKNSITEKNVTFFIKSLTFVDGIIAPLIYCFMNAKFKRDTQRQWSILLNSVRRRLSYYFCMCCGTGDAEMYNMNKLCLKVDKKSQLSHVSSFSKTPCNESCKEIVSLC